MIKIIVCDTKDRNIEEFHQRRKDRNSAILFSKIYQKKNTQWMYPYSIEIETVNRCNNTCSFCPVNRNNDTRPYQKMTDEFFYSLIEQLEAMRYKGYLSLFSNNEPLLDKRICRFVSDARKRLPDARLALFTNGILLTEEIFVQLINQLDYLVIDNYSDEMELIPSVAKVVSKYRYVDSPCDIKVYIRKKTQVLSSRGGEAPNRTLVAQYESGCMMPFMQIVVRPDGKISRCCQDGLGLSEIGDLRKQTIMDCWHTASRKRIWDELIKGGRKNLKECAYCDVFGHDNYMPPEWKPLIVSAFLDKTADNYMKKKKITLIGSDRFLRIMKEFLQSSGIRRIVTMESNPSEIREDAFYIVEDFDNSFLEQLDPYAVHAGDTWIVPEQIPTYMIKDYSEHAQRFGKILGSLLNSYTTDVYFAGTKENFILLKEQVKVRHIIWLGEKQLIDSPLTINSEGVFLLDATARNMAELLKKNCGISDDQILDYEKLLSFAAGE